MQNKKLRHLRQSAVQPVSSSPASKLNKFATILKTSKMQLIKAVIATLPG
jgi:hypothetical protein